MGKEEKQGWVVENEGRGGGIELQGIALREEEHKTAGKCICDVIPSALNSR